MASLPPSFTTIDEYIALHPPATQAMLAELRATIRAAAPQAEERISYRIPTFYLQGNLVHFAAYRHHLGFYPASSGIRNFAAELAAYKTSKGAVQFPLDQPLPLDLIRRIVASRVEENLRRAAAGAAGKHLIKNETKE